MIVIILVKADAGLNLDHDHGDKEMWACGHAWRYLRGEINCKTLNIDR